MNNVAVQAARTARLKASARRRSDESRNRAIEACARLLGSGIRVTFANVARDAQVSTWLTYNAEEVRAAIESAISQQQRDGIAKVPSVEHSRTPRSLRTDLELARAEVRELRAERDKLRKRLQSQLGAEVASTDVAELIQRIDDLERNNLDLQTRVSSSEASTRVLREENEKLVSEIDGKTEALRQLMWAANTGGR